MKYPWNGEQVRALLQKLRFLGPQRVFEEASHNLRFSGYSSKSCLKVGPTQSVSDIEFKVHKVDVE